MVSNSSTCLGVRVVVAIRIVTLFLSSLSCWALIPFGITSSFTSRPISSFLLPMSASTESLELTLDPKETAIVFIEYQNEFATEGGKLHDAVKDVMFQTKMLENSKKMADSARNSGCLIVHCPIEYDKVYSNTSCVFTVLLFVLHGVLDLSDVCLLVCLFVNVLSFICSKKKKSFSEIGKDPYGILAGVKNGKCFVEGEWGSSICESMKPVEGDIIVKGKRGLCAFHSTNLDFILRQNNIKNVVLGGFLTNCCVESTMRTAYENGYRVYTLKDCCAATSMAGQQAAYEHTFGMFSHPTTSDVIIKAVST